MNKVKFQKLLLSATIFIGFCIVFFVPRYFAHLQYDALEDEILSIDFNSGFLLKEFLLAPDLVHPPLWYMLMDYPTSVLGLDHGIFYYRLIQVLSLFSIIIFTLIYFYKKLPNKFLFTFFALFLSNIYLIHLTFQHRMYAMILGISIFYSFYWYHVIKNGADESFKHFIALGLIAAIGFFINYSIIWLIPIWPLSYLFYKRNSHSLKRLIVFSSTFLILIAWFIPTFIKNTLFTGSITNEYYLDFNVTNFLKLFADFFGIIPTNDQTSNNLLVGPYFLLLFCLFFFSKKSNKILYRQKMIIFTVFFFLSFLFFGIFNDFILLVPRTSITIIIAFYILMADSFSSFKYSKNIVYLLIFFQLTQFTIYFANDSKNLTLYNLFNYRKHPMHYFSNFNFLENSCLITMPVWNEFSAQYYIGDKVKILSSDKLWKDLDFDQLTCNKIYVLDQTSVDREDVALQIRQIKDYGFSFVNLISHQNQTLYILNYSEER